jgi:hypothetical protein
VDQDYVGRSGDVGGYQVEIGDDRVRVLKDRVEVFGRPVKPHGGRSIGAFVADAGKLHLTWGRQPEGDEVVVISDADDPRPDAPRFVINVSDPDLSGWTTVPGLLPGPSETEFS